MNTLAGIGFRTRSDSAENNYRKTFCLIMFIWIWEFFSLTRSSNQLFYNSQVRASYFSINIKHKPLLHFLSECCVFTCARERARFNRNNIFQNRITSLVHIIIIHVHSVRTANIQREKREKFIFKHQLITCSHAIRHTPHNTSMCTSSHHIVITRFSCEKSKF